jgi:hypothetical protein
VAGLHPVVGVAPAVEVGVAPAVEVGVGVAPAVEVGVAPAAALPLVAAAALARAAPRIPRAIRATSRTTPSRSVDSGQPGLQSQMKLAPASRKVPSIPST